MRESNKIVRFPRFIYFILYIMILIVKYHIVFSNEMKKNHKRRISVLPGISSGFFRAYLFFVFDLFFSLRIHDGDGAQYQRDPENL